MNSIHPFADIPMETPGHQTQPQTEMSMKVNEIYSLLLRELHVMFRTQTAVIYLSALNSFNNVPGVFHCDLYFMSIEKS